jgi:hypothetical protein
MPETSSHATFRQLVDRRDGVLSGARAAAVEAHLAPGCAHCESELLEIAALQSGIAAERLPAPPRAVLRRAKRLFRGVRARAALAAVERVVARLVFDQRLQAVPALRSGPGAARRLLWTVGDLELFVTLQRTGAHWMLQGEFLPQEDDGESRVDGDVAIVGPFGPVAAIELDAEGCFAFRDLGPSTYELEAVVNGAHVRVPAFVVD